MLCVTGPVRGSSRWHQNSSANHSAPARLVSAAPCGVCLIGFQLLVLRLIRSLFFFCIHIINHELCSPSLSGVARVFRGSTNEQLSYLRLLVTIQRVNSLCIILHHRNRLLLTADGQFTLSAAERRLFIMYSDRASWGLIVRPDPLLWRVNVWSLV